MATIHYHLDETGRIPVGECDCLPSGEIVINPADQARIEAICTAHGDTAVCVDNLVLWLTPPQSE